MAAVYGIALAGVVSAAGAGFVLGTTAFQQFQRQRRVARQLAQAGSSGAVSWLQWRVRHGVAVLNPLGEWLLCRPKIARYLSWVQNGLEEKGLAPSPLATATCFLAVVLFCVATGWVLSGTPVFGAALAGCVVVAAGGYGKACAEKRACALRDEVPDALRSLSVCFRAGLSLMQTLRQTGSELKGPLGAVFLSAARVLETGGTASEALVAFKQRSGTPELAFVGVALDVQHQSGGSLAHVLDAARESVEGEIELSRSLRVETAQATLSARIVTIMPFVLIALFSLVSPGFLAPFFSSWGGLLLLAAALAMQVAGVLLVHRTLNVEVS